MLLKPVRIASLNVIAFAEQNAQAACVRRDQIHLAIVVEVAKDQPRVLHPGIGDDRVVKCTVALAEADPDATARFLHNGDVWLLVAVEVDNHSDASPATGGHGNRRAESSGPIAQKHRARLIDITELEGIDLAVAIEVGEMDG